MTCAYCGSGKVSRSHRKGVLELLMSAVLIYPYRCEACKKRSYTLSRTRTAEVTKNWNRIRTQLLVYSIGLICCMILVYFLIQERMPASE